MAKTFLTELRDEIAPIVSFVTVFLIMMAGVLAFGFFCRFTAKMPSMQVISWGCEIFDMIYSLGAFSLFAINVIAVLVRRIHGTVKRCFGNGSKAPMPDPAAAGWFHIRMFTAHLIVSIALLCCILLFHAVTIMLEKIIGPHFATIAILREASSWTAFIILIALAVNALTEVTSMALKTLRS